MIAWQTLIKPTKRSVLIRHYKISSYLLENTVLLTYKEQKL